MGSPKPFSRCVAVYLCSTIPIISVLADMLLVCCTFVGRSSIAIAGSNSPVCLKSNPLTSLIPLCESIFMPKRNINASTHVSNLNIYSRTVIRTDICVYFFIFSFYFSFFSFFTHCVRCFFQLSRLTRASQAAASIQRQ